MGVPWYVSQADVVKHPEYGNGGTLEEILHDFGMDIRFGFLDDGRWKGQTRPDSAYKNVDESEDYYDFYHISLLGEKVKCPRYVGVARTDGVWRRYVSDTLNLPAEFKGRRK